MIALLCPGQGSQTRPDPARWAAHPAAMEVLADWQAVTGLSLADLARRPEAGLFAPDIAQPLICAWTLANHAANAETLPRVRMAAGLSLGELTAHACAGTIDARTALHLARERGRLMQAATVRPAAMIGLRGPNLGQLQALARAAGFDLAIRHAPDHCVVAGALAGADELVSQVAEAGGVANVLPVPAASHTAALREAAMGFGRVLAATPMSDPRFPVLSGRDGRPVRRKADALAALVAQIWQPLDWGACLAAVAESRVAAVLDLGPGAGMAVQMRNVAPDLPARSVEDFANPGAAARWAARQGHPLSE